MGIGIQQWRIRIGCFCQPKKTVFRINVFIVNVGSKWKLTFRVTTCILALLIISGDIESNPGPPKTTKPDDTRKLISDKAQKVISKDSQSKVPHPHGADQSGACGSQGVTTRQMSVSSFTTSSSQNWQSTPPTSPAQCRSGSRNSTGRGGQGHRGHQGLTPLSTQVNTNSNACTDRQDTDMYDFLKIMKSDLTTQNNRVSSDINKLNAKLDTVLTTVNELKTDYETLKQENISLKHQMCDMRNKLDQYENNSRRNNIRFNGIKGKIDEQWSITEEKLRNFLRNELNFGSQADEFDIDRAHRIKSSDSNTCTIIARFVRFKDCQLIFKRATQLFKPGQRTQYSIQQDYSDRVRRHRKLLGERMISERNNGHYASVRFNKLIVDDNIYKYDDLNDEIVLVGKRSRTRASPRSRENYRSSNAQRLADSQHENRIHDSGTSHDNPQPIDRATGISEDGRESESFSE